MVLESYYVVVRCDGLRHNCYGVLIVSNPPQLPTRNGMKTHRLAIAALSVDKKREEYVSVEFRQAMRDSGLGESERLHIGERFAKSLGLVDGSMVDISLVDSQVTPPVCYKAYCEVSQDDWPIVEKNQQELERRLLEQITVVKKGMVVPVWLKSNVIEITIVSTEPPEKFTVLDTENGVGKSRTRVILDVQRGKKSFPSSPEVSRHRSRSPKVQQRRITSKYSTAPISNGCLAVGNGDVRSRASSVSSGILSGSEEDFVPTGLVDMVARDDRTGKRSSSWHMVSSPDVGLESKHRRENSSGMLGTVVDFFGRFLPAGIIPGDTSVDDETLLKSKTYAARAPAVQVVVKDVEVRQSVLIDLPEEGCLLRVQRTPNHFLQEILKFSDLCSEDLKALVKQPTTVFVSDESFPNLRGKQEGLCRAYVTIELAERTKSVQPNDSTPASTVTSPATSDTSSKTTSVRSSAENPFSSAGKKTLDSKKGFVPDDPGEQGKAVVATGRLFVCDSRRMTHVARDHVVMHDAMRRFLGAAATVCVRIKKLHHRDSKVQGISLHPLFDNVGGVYELDKVKSFRNWIESITTDDCPLPIVNNQLVVFNIIHQPTVGQKDFIVNVVTPQPTFGSQPLPNPLYFLLSTSRIQSIRITALGDPVSPPDACSEDQRPAHILPRSVDNIDPVLPNKFLSELGGRAQIAQEGLNHLRTCLTRRLVHSLGSCCSGLAGGGLLISGTSRDSGTSNGCGKSSLALGLCREMAELPVLAHIVIVECTTLRGRRVDNVKSDLEKKFDEAACRQPSVILLENLDDLVAAPTAGATEGGGDVLYTTKLAEMICDMINAELQRNTVLALMATARSADALHPRLLPGRGQHYFQKVLELPVPTEEERKEILEAIVSSRGYQRNPKECNLSIVAHDTMGFVPGDLDKLVEQAAHWESSKKVKRRARHKMPRGSLFEPVAPGDSMPRWTDGDTLTQESFTEVLKSLKPASLRSLSLHSPGELRWSDVGGLAEVKNTLIETLEWPIKYPKLFAQCPLRLQSGLLLYGAPGTGKTLLAGVVARECGVNFISVKGPELLNKFIGTSEQSVRQMFERAQSAKPCVLFFDEFDSIAPKRGHDNTGVTDRVVNMFLTQMDGVESLQGVYVLAATSRPDLIDPALLRPGRLDKSLFCPLPNQSERKAILSALACNVRVCDKVDYDSLAEDTENFSGADLKALWYNAQLEAIRASEVFSPNFATTPLEVDKLPPSLHSMTASLSLDEVKEDIEDSLTDSLSKNSVIEIVRSLRYDVKTPPHPPNVGFAFSPDQMRRRKRSSTPSGQLRLTPFTERLASSTSSSCVSYDGNDYYFVPRIADGVQKIPAEVRRDMKHKYTESYYSRTGYMQDRRLSLASSHRKVVESKKTQVVVTNRHLAIALCGMGPSLSETERKKYQAIYERFAKTRSAEISPEHLQQKATLA